jgi:hypothetical protein
VESGSCAKRLGSRRVAVRLGPAARDTNILFSVAQRRRDTSCGFQFPGVRVELEGQAVYNVDAVPV